MCVHYGGGGNSKLLFLSHTNICKLKQVDKTSVIYSFILSSGVELITIRS